MRKLLAEKGEGAGGLEKDEPETVEVEKEEEAVDVEMEEDTGWRKKGKRRLPRTRRVAKGMGEGRNFLFGRSARAA